ALTSRSTIRISFSMFGRLSRVRRMKVTCWSRLGSDVMPDSRGLRMVWVSTYTRAEVSYWLGSLSTIAQPASATVQVMITACQRYFPIAFRKDWSAAVSSAICLLVKKVPVAGQAGEGGLLRGVSSSEMKFPDVND